MTEQDNDPARRRVDMRQEPDFQIPKIRTEADPEDPAGWDAMPMDEGIRVLYG